ncbi:MAG: hypothetical protein LC112_14000 [Flavobacteriales bacterium]|nr:hypothetical protein [Flavobacteriales bacterium]
MADNKELKRIYRIEVQGIEAATKKVEQLNQEIQLQNQIKKEAQKILIANPGDAVQIEKQSKVIAQSEVQLKKLNAEKRIAIKEADALITAQERIAKAEIKASQEATLAAGSYKALFAESKKLNELYRSTAPSDPMFEQIKQDAIAAQKAVHDFNRTLAPDGTLVGEYSKGIINAFKSADMGDILRNQVQKGEQALAQLDDSLEQLKREYQEMKDAGVEGLDAIEKKLIENRQQAITLSSQVGEMREQLASTGNVGNEVTTGIKNGFKNLSSELVNTAIAFVGIQAGINAVQNFASGAIGEFEQAELATARFEARLQNLGRGNELDDIKNTIDELAEKFKSLDNDDLTEAAEKLVTYGKLTKQQIQNILPLIIDFAANQRIGIGEATSVIIKGLEGQGKALKEYGINLKDAKNTTEAYGILTDELAKKVEGSAETFENTATGAMAIQRQELKNQQEILGERLIPIYVKFLQILATLAGVLVAIPFPLFASGLVLMIGLTNTWIGSKLRLAAAFVLEKGALVIETVQLGISNGVRATATFLTNVHALAVTRAATASGVAAVAYRALAAAITFATGPIGITIGLIAAFTTILGVMSAKASSSATSMKKMKGAQDGLILSGRVLDEVNRKVTESTSDQISKINLLTAVVNDTTLSDKARKQALNELIQISPLYRNALKGEAIDINEVTKASEKLIAQLKEQARVKATQALLEEKTKKLVENEYKIKELEPEASKLDVTKNKIGFGQGAKAIFQSAGKSIGIGDGTAAEQQFDLMDENRKLREDIDQLTNQRVLDYQNGLATSITTQNQNAEIVSQANKNFESTKIKQETKKPKTAQEIRDERIKALKDEEETQKKLTEIKFKKGEIDEVAYLEKINSIVQDYAKKKLVVLEKAAKDEAGRIADVQLEKINSEKDTNDKIFKIKEDALNKEFQLLEFKEDPKKSKTQNAEEQLRVDNENKSRIQKHQNDLLILQNQYHIKNADNEKKWAEEIKNINEKLANDTIELSKAKLEDAKEAGDTQLAEFKAQMAARRLELLKQGKDVKGLDKEEKLGTVARQLASLNAQFVEIEKLYKEGQISAKEYYDFLAERDSKAAELYELQTARIGKSFKERLQNYKGVKDLISGELSNNLLTPKNEDGSDKEGYAWIGESISQTFDIAKQAMNDYFDSKRARIEEEKQYELDKLNIEKEQRLSRAQSRAEEQNINRQYEKQKREIEKKAFEEQKKLKKSEAKIALATELANIAVQAAANPANAATFGAAGLIQFAVLGALAAGRYALRVSEINSQKFEKGGWLRSGGEISGPSHSQGGVPFNTAEAEGNELAIVNKKSASLRDVFTVTGTTKQIASAINEVGGGKRFAMGGKLSKLEYGGTFGKQLSIPGDTSYLRDDGMRDMIIATNNRIDNIKVYNVARETEKVNNDYKKASQINTL